MTADHKGDHSGAGAPSAIRWQILAAFALALPVGWIVGLVLSAEGLYTVRYGGALLAGTIAVFGTLCLGWLLGLSEETSVRVALVVCAFAAVVAIRDTGDRIFRFVVPSVAEMHDGGNWVPPRSLLGAFRLRARYGVVHGFREHHTPSEQTQYPRRGIWVWICWAVQLVLLPITSVVGALAGGVLTADRRKLPPGEQRPAPLEGLANQVEASLSKIRDPLVARAAGAMIRGSDDLPEIAAALQERKMREETGDLPDEVLLKGLEMGQTPWVNEALDRGANPCVVGQRGIPAIGLAAQWGRVDVASLLLDRGAMIDSTGTRQETALHLAAKEGCADMCRFLLERGAALEARGRSGRTALHEACAAGRLEVVEVLAAQGARIDVVDASQEQPIHTAAAQGRANIVEWLLNEGADIEVPTRHDRTPLGVAVLGRQPEVVRILLAAGANVHSRPAGGATQLMRAADASDMELVKILLAAGADRHATDANGLTAFDYAERCERPSNDNKSILALLHTS